jgi:hypothetical protein
MRDQREIHIYLSAKDFRQKKETSPIKKRLGTFVVAKRRDPFPFLLEANLLLSAIMLGRTNGEDRRRMLEFREL